MYFNSSVFFTSGADIQIRDDVNGFRWYNSSGSQQFMYFFVSYTDRYLYDSILAREVFSTNSTAINIGGPESDAGTGISQPLNFIGEAFNFRPINDGDSADYTYLRFFNATGTLQSYIVATEAYSYWYSSINAAYIIVSNATVISLNSLGTTGANTACASGTCEVAITGDLYVTGSGYKPGGGSWTAASDRRLKKDIADFTDGLSVIRDIHPVWYRYTEKSGYPDTDQRYVGVIAQEVQKVAPYAVGLLNRVSEEGDHYLSFDPSALQYVAVNAIRELGKLVDSAQAEIASLWEAVAGLDTRMHRLERENRELWRDVATMRAELDELKPDVCPEGREESTARGEAPSSCR